MDDLLKDSPELKESIQSLLFRIDQSGGSVTNVLQKLSDDDWYELSEELATVSDVKLIKYILSEESNKMKGADVIEHTQAETSKPNIRHWVIRRVVGVLTIAFLALSLSLIVLAPEEVAGIVKEMLSLITPSNILESD